MVTDESHNSIEYAWVARFWSGVYENAPAEPPALPIDNLRASSQMPHRRLIAALALEPPVHDIFCATPPCHELAGVVITNGPVADTSGTKKRSVENCISADSLKIRLLRTC